MTEVNAMWIKFSSAFRFLSCFLASRCAYRFRISKRERIYFFTHDSELCINRIVFSIIAAFYVALKSFLIALG